MLLVLLAGTVVAGALIAAFVATILVRAGGMSAPLSRAITFPIIPLGIYPVLKVRAVMRRIEFSTPFWKWAIVWSVLMFLSNLYVAPAIERMLE
ncbi:MAG TPA: hypothetical protein VHW00_11940 [Thermoanaerobaculia bacterium]|nr:hypothetical protein [Thermoanaerobaculia bacterium]